MKVYWEGLWAEDPRDETMADGRALTICIGRFIFTASLARRKQKRRGGR